jgi:hypothetical protein
MPVYKRKYRSGKVVWYYQFAPPGSTRDKQNLLTESGFATKQEAIAAEATRRTAEMARLAATGGVAAPMPTTLAMLLAEFMKQHAEENLAPKTVERRVTSDRVEAGTANQSALLDAEAAIWGAQADVLRAELTN